MDLADLTPPDMGPDPDDPGVAREPPWSPEAEQSICGALLVDPRALELVGDVIGPEHFFSKSHRVIFSTCQALVVEQCPCDVVTVFLRLKESYEDEDFGGLQYLNALAQSVPSAANARAYAQIVADKALERAAIRACEDAAQLAWNASQPLVTRLDRIAGTLAQLEEQRRGTRGRLPCLTLAELGGMRRGIRWVVKHAIPRGSVGVLFGASGTFKSFVAIDLALHVAHGMPWLGKRADRGAVMYLAAEGQAGIYDRIDAWHRLRGASMKGADVRVIPVAVDVLNDAWRVVERAQAVGMRPDLVVVDTLSQTFSGEENNASEMAAYFRALGRFREMWDCAVVVVHHSGHSATERPRGSSAIRANVDFMFGCFRDEKEMIARLTCQKQKDGDPLQDHEFKLHRVELEPDEDNEATSSLAAWHLSTTDEVAGAHEEEAAAGRSGRDTQFMALVQGGIDEFKLRKAFYDLHGDLDYEAKKKAYFRARKRAMDAGLIEVKDGVVMDTRKAK